MKVLVSCVLYCINHGPEILKRCIELDVVGRPDYKPAAPAECVEDEPEAADAIADADSATEGGDGSVSSAGAERAEPAALSEESDQPAAVAEGELEEAATKDAASWAETDAVLEGPGKEETDPAEGRECSSSESPAESEPGKD